METATVHYAKLGPAQVQFMHWLAATHPKIYAKVMPQSDGLSGVADKLADGFNSLMKNATNLMSQFVQGKEQVAVFKANVQRAKQGQPLVAPNAISATVPSVPTWVWVAGGAALVLLMLRGK